MVVAFTIILLFVLLALGVPVAFSLGICGCLGLFLTDGFSSLFSILSTTPYRTVASFSLTAVPMFVLMAEFASSGRLATQLFYAANRWVGHFPGGMGIGTVLASAGFGAMCGSSVAGAATMSRIAIPDMLKIGYDRKIASATVAVAGTLSAMIPPSVPMVIYGITTESSIGKLLIAGILPGIMTALVYSLGIAFWAKLSPGTMPAAAKSSWKERFLSLKGIWPFLVLVLLVIGGMYTGVATPSEVAALGALGALIICLVLRTIDLKGILEAVERTILTTTMIFAIIIGAMIFGYFLTTTQVAQNTIAFIANAGIPSWAVMSCLVVLYIILGCFLDQIAILLITLPLTFPLVTSLGYDGIWFGVIIIKLVEIGLITPPLGMNVYVTSGTANIPLDEVFRGVGMLLIFEGITLILLLAFPQIALFLPGLMR